MVIARARNFCLIWTLLLNLQLMVPVFTEEPVQPPPVEEATKDNFVTFARNNPYLLVLFYEPGCMTCEEAKLTMSQLETPELFPGELKKIQISDVALAATYGAFTSPGFVLFRHGTGSPVVYDGVTVDTENIGGWLDVASDIATKSLTDDSFEHLTQAATGATTGDWLVAYYKDSCSKILFAMESFGVRMKRKMNIAKVAMETNPRLVKRMKVTKCPSVIFYKQGKMYRYEVEKYDTKSLTSFVEGWYKNMKAESVPVDPSSFDELTENIAKALKDQIEGPNRFTFLTIAGGVVSLVLLILVCACVMSRRVHTINPNTEYSDVIRTVNRNTGYNDVLRTVRPNTEYSDVILTVNRNTRCSDVLHTINLNTEYSGVIHTVNRNTGCSDVLRTVHPNTEYSDVLRTGNWSRIQRIK